MRVFKFILVLILACCFAFSVWKKYYRTEVTYKYFENGNVSIIFKYNNKTKIQCQENFTEEGHLKEKVCVKNNKIIGKRYSYFRNGNISGSLDYKNGFKEGKFYAFFETGELKSTVDYIKGLKQGEQTHYHENGQLKSVAHYKDNVMYKLQMNKPDSFIVESMLDTISYWPIVSLNKDSFERNDTLTVKTTFPTDEMVLSKNDTLLFRYGFTGDTTNIESTYLEEILSEETTESSFVVADSSGSYYLYGLVTLIKDKVAHDFPISFWEITVL